VEKKKRIPPPGFIEHPERIHRTGRPKGSLNIATRLKMLLEIGDEFTTVLKAQIEKAKEGDTRAAEFIANRLEGLPKATLLTQEIPPVQIIDHESNADIQDEPTE